MLCVCRGTLTGLLTMDLRFSSSDRLIINKGSSLILAFKSTTLPLPDELYDTFIISY